MHSFSVLILDPGNSTGWLFVEYNGQGQREGDVYGGTISECHLDVGRLIAWLRPDVVIYETFQLYPGKANHMQWNSFYPCEVIGVIKYCVGCRHNTELVGLQPSVKKYAGVTDEWKEIHSGEKLLSLGIDGKNPWYGTLTEHTRDTYRLWKYWDRNEKQKYLDKRK